MAAEQFGLHKIVLGGGQARLQNFCRRVLGVRARGPRAEDLSGPPNNQSISHSVSQSIHQSINQSSEAAKGEFGKKKFAHGGPDRSLIGPGGGHTRFAGSRGIPVGLCLEEPSSGGCCFDRRRSITTVGGASFVHAPWCSKQCNSG